MRKEKIHMYLDWILNIQFTGLIVALEKGWYEDADLDVELIPWDGASNVAEILSDDKKERNSVVSLEDNLFIQEIERGGELKAVATMFQRSPIGLIVRADSEIQKPQDLLGKRIGVHVDGKTMVDYLLYSLGADTDAVKLVEVGDDLWMFENGELDAYQSYAMIEPPALESKGLEVDFFPAIEWGYEVYSQVMAVNSVFAEERPEVLRRFLEATFRGWRHAAEYTDESARIVSEKVGDYDADFNRRMLESMMPWITGDLPLGKFGTMRLDRWKKSIDIYREMNLIETNPDPGEFVENTFLKVGGE